LSLRVAVDVYDSVAAQAVFVFGVAAVAFPLTGVSVVAV